MIVVTTSRASPIVVMPIEFSLVIAENMTLYVFAAMMLFDNNYSVPMEMMISEMRWVKYNSGRGVPWSTIKISAMGPARTLVNTVYVLVTI